LFFTHRYRSYICISFSVEYNSNISINEAQHHRCFSPRELHRTHIEIKVKETEKKTRKKERSNYLLSFSLFFFLPSGNLVFKNNKLKKKVCFSNYCRYSFISFLIHVDIYITDMNIIDFFFLSFVGMIIICVLFSFSLVWLCHYLFWQSINVFSTVIVFTDNND